MSPDTAQLSVAGAVVGFDHVALPMRSPKAMIAFYRSLGLSVSENPSARSGPRWGADDQFSPA
jgi:catechol 2,3-dioxygenase-like lactoylglutathione lyase family enzyme